MAGPSDSLVESAYGWLRVAAAGFRRAHGGKAPALDELVAEGAVLLASLVGRYEVSRGATFATFCSPYVNNRWECMRRRSLREPPVGGWVEVLGLMRVEGSVMEGDPEHQRRAHDITDAFMTTSVLTADQLDEAVDIARFFVFIETLPEPQRSLLLGLYHDGNTLSELTRKLNLKRGTARSQVFLGMRALSRHFVGEPQ